MRVRAELDDGNFRHLRDREAGGGEVFGDGDDGFDFSGVDGGGQRGELRGGQCRDEAGDERAADVGITVGGDEKLVALPRPADEMRLRVERGLAEARRILRKRDPATARRALSSMPLGGQFSGHGATPP